MNLLNVKLGNVIFCCMAVLVLHMENICMAQGVGANETGVNPPTLNELAAHYPSGSIQSVDGANAALIEVEQQRTSLEQRYKVQEHICYDKFFATSCLDKVQDMRREGLAQIQKVEIEANSFLRSDRVLQREKILAEKRKNEANNPPKKLIESPNSGFNQQQQQPDHKIDSAQRLINVEEKLKKQQQEEIDDAPKRAANVEAFEKKAKDAAARQLEVAKKKAEKQQKEAAKAAASSTASPPNVNP